MASKPSVAIEGTEKEFLKVFDGLCYSRQPWQVWSDVITAMACSLANSVDKHSEMWDAREKEYMECEKRLGGVEKVSHLFSIMVIALERNPEQDFLGKMYMQLNLGNHWTGQFFTPYNVCSMMAKVSLGSNLKEQTEEKGFITLNDPACGAGATLVAAAGEMRRQNVNYQQNALITGQDIDRITGMMCYIQLSLLGCAGYVCIANTLSNPMVGPVLKPIKQKGQEFWFTPMYFHPVWQFRILFHQFDTINHKTPSEQKELTQQKNEKEGFFIFFNFEKEEALWQETK